METHTLYSRDSKGNIVEWSICIYRMPDEDNSSSEDIAIEIKSGRLGTNNKPNIRYVTKGKNLGKSNETSPYRQALLETAATYEHKRKEGYKSREDLGIEWQNDISGFNGIYSIKDTKECYNTLTAAIEAALPKYRTDENDNLKPMKCQSYFKLEDKTRVVSNAAKKFKYPCFIQPKLNGVRCVIRKEEVQEAGALFGASKKVVIRSNEGLEYHVPHITAIFEKMIWGIDGIEIVYDGELYIPTIHVTSISGAARNIDNPFNPQLEYWIFDLSINEVQSRRFKMINLIKEAITPPCSISYSTANSMNHYGKKDSIVFLNTDIVYNKDQAIRYAKDCIKSGYEGAVIRDMDATYKFGSRSSTMLKIKFADDEEFEIIDIKLSNRSGTVIFVCRNDINDGVFDVDGTKEFLDIKYYEEKYKYIGLKATVQYYERTINDLPFHCTLLAIRDYEI